MIPSLTAHGLLPPGIHECTLDQLRAAFGLGVRRLQLLDGLDRCLRLMNDEHLEGIVVIDGSFVTDKERPDDIELTLDVRHLDHSKQDRALLFQLRHFSDISRMGVDWYPTLPSQQDFTLFFQRVGEKTAAAKRIPASGNKGILKLNSW